MPIVSTIRTPVFSLKPSSTTWIIILIFNNFTATGLLLEGFEQLIKNKKPLASRDILADVLTEQYTRISDIGYPISDLVSSNIQFASRGRNTYTITTGHQLNIFTGPLYFIFKIATAIKLSQTTKRAFPR